MKEKYLHQSIVRTVTSDYERRQKQLATTYCPRFVYRTAIGMIDGWNFDLKAFQRILGILGCYYDPFSEIRSYDIWSVRRIFVVDIKRICEALEVILLYSAGKKRSFRILWQLCAALQWNVYKSRQWDKVMLETSLEDYIKRLWGLLCGWNVCKTTEEIEGKNLKRSDWHSTLLQSSIFHIFGGNRDSCSLSRMQSLTYL